MSKNKKQKLEELKSNDWLLPLLLFAAAFLIYANSFSGEFIHGDDEHIITFNRYLKDWRHFPKLFTENLKGGFGMITNYYRPLQLAVYWLIANSIGMKTWAFHLANVVFHGLCGVFLFLILKRLFAQTSPILLAALALLWLTHPVHVEEIALPSGIASPLHLFWMLVSLWSFLRFLGNDEGRGWLWQILSLSAYLAGILSKESAIVLAALVAATHATLARRNPQTRPTLAQAFKIHAPYWIVAGAYMLARMTMLNFDNSFNFYDKENVLTQNLSYRIYTSLTTLAYSIKLFFLPTGLHPERHWSVYTQFLSAPVFLSALTLALCLAAALWAWKKEARLTLGIAWFFIAFSPMSNIVALINALFWEHWLFAPSVGIILALAACLAYKEWLQKRATPLILLAAIALGIYSFNRNFHWRDSETYFTYIVNFEPRKAKLWTNLGMAMANKGRHAEAVKHYLMAIELEDSYAETHHNLGNAYLYLGRPKEAEEEFIKALRINSNFYHSYLLLARLYLVYGHRQAAIASLQKALAIFPNMPEVAALLNELQKQQGS